MKKIIAFVALSTMFLVFSSTAEKKTPSGINISGTWEETWGTRDENNGVDYHDQYVIRQKKGTITMSCKGRPTYTFAHIHLTDKNFTFQLTNPNNPDDIYVIAYNLYLNETATAMNGTAVTNKGVEAKIVLRKIK